ncbi:hypothetical protein [Aureibacter tunicatorum]|uniref:Uncharacterized protein n=1 Tax=Aureibacter tunicatorum TaxID=866807 RepID=A0AAE4BQU9_9BACT|nr:hypothetical protein [Aureibacter tunicatorum]MDR6237115.1 hypothetical protein [Aureibacter tunicatorum]BDD06107.1 hypothetical protein AUTU_35900 [Aureibacter tunicatorum]
MGILIDKFKKRRSSTRKAGEFAMNKMPPSVVEEDDWEMVDTSDSVNKIVIPNGPSSSRLGLFKPSLAKAQKKYRILSNYFPVNEPSNPQYMQVYVKAVEDEMRTFDILRATVQEDEIFELAKRDLITLGTKAKAFVMQTVDFMKPSDKGGDAEEDGMNIYEKSMIMLREFVYGKADEMSSIQFPVPFLEAVIHISFRYGVLKQLQNYTIGLALQHNPNFPNQ